MDFCTPEKLLKKNATDDVRLTDQQTAILLLLAAANGELVEQNRLEREIWHNRVSDNTVKTAITNLRKCFDDEGKSVIVNERGKGYRLHKVTRAIEPTTGTEPGVVFGHQNKVLFLFLCVLIFGIFSWEVKQAVSDDEHLVVPPKEFQIMTYELGDEFGSSTHNDGNLLAYTSSSGSIFDSKVTVKDKRTQKTKLFSEFDFSSSPHWAGNSLYYQVYQEHQCSIVRSVYHSNLNFEAPERIADCGTELSVSPVSVDRYQEWLYFSYKPSPNKPFVIKRVNLRNKQVQQLTTDNDENFGAFNLALSPNAERVAYLSADAADSVHLRLLALDTLTVTELGPVFGTIGQMDWLSERELLIPSAKTLIAIDILSHVRREARRFDERVYGVEVTPGNSIVLSYGNLYKSKLVEFEAGTVETLGEVGSQLGSVIKSQSDGSLYYLSNQSGKTEIWRSYNGEKSQLTSEERGRRIRQLRLNETNNRLYYLLDKDLKAIELATGKVHYVTEEALAIQNYTFNCEGSEVLATTKFNGIWKLYRFDALGHSSPIVIKNDIYDIQADCQNFRYATASHFNKEIKIYDGQFNQPEKIFHPPTSFADSKWDFQDNALYYLYQGKLHVFEDGDERVLLTPEDKNWFFNSFSISDSNVVLTQKSKSNTYLIEITKLDKT